LTFTILFIGDIVGKAGRRAVDTFVQDILRDYHVNFVIANGENAAGGVGITPDIADQLFAAGIDVLTSGNHIWQKKEILDYLCHEKRLIRPLNFSPDAPGVGSCLVTTAAGITVAVVNVAGRVFMETYSCPFRAIDQAIEQLHRQADLIVVDFHAEATSEKMALGWYLDGRVSAVIGTHTHVQTADERILPQGTAYITDVGMTGARDSVIGVKKELAIQKFLTYMPVRFESSVGDPWLEGVMLTLDPERGVALQIQRIQRSGTCSLESMRSERGSV
jgi:metallophosphoesterase (TIGR00282 family)